MPAAPKKYTPNPDALAQKMTAARLERKMTQGQLADRLGVRQSMVSMIETGEVRDDEEASSSYGEGLQKRIKSWIESGAGPTKKSARGPYSKQRTTLPTKR